MNSVIILSRTLLFSIFCIYGIKKSSSFIWVQLLLFCAWLTGFVMIMIISFKFISKKLRLTTLYDYYTNQWNKMYYFCKKLYSQLKKNSTLFTMNCNWRFWGKCFAIQPFREFYSYVLIVHIYNKTMSNLYSFCRVNLLFLLGNMWHWESVVNFEYTSVEILIISSH